MPLEDSSGASIPLTDSYQAARGYCSVGFLSRDRSGRGGGCSA